MPIAGASESRGAKSRRVRVGGSNFTIFLWQNEIIGWANQTSIVSPTPVGSGATPIHPLDSPYPVDIITPAAQNIGTMTLEMWELYNAKVWERLQGLAGTPDLANIFLTMASMGEAVQLVKLIRPPKLTGINPANITAENQKEIAAGAPQYGELYKNVTITNVEDGETINIGTMDIIKRVTIAYTQMIPISPTSGAYENLAEAFANGELTGKAKERL